MFVVSQFSGPDYLGAWNRLYHRNTLMFNVKCGILVVVVVVLRKEEIEDTKGIHIKQLVR